MSKLRNASLAVMLCAALGAHAQAVPEPVQFVVTPEIPGPAQEVRVEAQGIGSFLGDAAITWRKDGETVSSGVGARTYTFTTGAIGSATRIQITISSASEGTITREFVFRPSAVNLVWEADTSVPPFYAGKPLYTGGSALKVAAFPQIVINGARVAAQSLSFQWARNGQSLPQSSGIGRSTLAFSGDQLQQAEEISVDLYLGSALVGRGGAYIAAAPAQVLLYERDPLRGVIYDQALPAAISLGAREITVAAQPYYFSNSSVAGGSISYAWTLEGNEITGPDSARGLVTLRQSGEGEGSASLGVSLQNNDQDLLVQSAEAFIRIVFGAQAAAGASFFGL